MTDALRLASVTRRFGGLTAIDNVSITFAPGEMAAIVGPNGAGKSTLIQIATGFVRPGSGRVMLGERDITHAAPETIAALGIGRSFQTSRVFPALSVMESVMVGAQATLLGATGNAVRNHLSVVREMASVALRRPSYRRRHAELEAKAETVMKLFGDRLWPNRHNPAFSLSYANRRRLEIARVLLGEPSILLLDEPTAGMNPTETRELSDLIAELHSARPELTIVLVEHKLDVVRRLAHRVIVLNQGRVIVEASPDGALSDPRVVEAYLGTRAGSDSAAPVPAESSGAGGG